MIQQLPVPSEPAAPAALAAPSAPGAQTTPVTSASPASPASDMLAFFDNREVQLAGGGLLLLLLLIWTRQRRSARLRAMRAKLDTASAPAPQPSLPAEPVRPSEPPQPQPPVRNPASADKPATEPPPRQKAPSLPHPEQPQAKPRAETSSIGAARSNDQALELAEIMLAMGLGQGAAKTLTQQIHDKPKGALRNWLKLLEIYRQNGQQQEFECSAEELRQHFNVQPEDWQTQPEMQRSIEDYPHIAARLTELWGKPYCSSYLANLLDDNRDGARAGFPQSVAEELLLLAAMQKSDNA